jgi:hypothetical protein
MQKQVRNMFGIFGWTKYHKSPIPKPAFALSGKAFG